jgi:hypothetical protein
MLKDLFDNIILVNEADDSHLSLALRADKGICLILRVKPNSRALARMRSEPPCSPEVVWAYRLISARIAPQYFPNSRV